MTTIDQFMWGFQHHFRLGLESTTQQVFDRVGFGLGPRAYLIGFAVHNGLPHQVCFEPETDELAQFDATQVATLADEIFENSPESRILYGYAPLHERKQRQLRDYCRAQALQQTLESSALGQGRTFRVGASSTVDEHYAVHPILAFPTARWNAKPTLRSRTYGRIAVEPSFQDAIVTQILAEATAAMRTQTAPQGFGSLSGGPTLDEIIQKAAQTLTRSAAVLAGYPFGSELHSALDAVAAQPYEGRSSIGRVLLARSDHPEVESTLSFVEPIPIVSTRRFRKALEMTDDSLSLLCDGEQLVGLGRLRERACLNGSNDGLAEPDNDETLYSFEIMGRGEWQLTHRGSHLLRVNNTQAAFPADRLSEERFKDVSSRLFGDASEADLDALWDLASAAAGAEHGTILVIHRDAFAEAERLAPQAQRIEPTLLSAEVLSAVTSIDGAVLVDPAAKCHGVGVILDGIATGQGDPGRGARFNSAIRYHHAVGNDALIVIVSEDGMIDLVPLLNRRVRVDEIERPVAVVEASAASLDWETFFRSWRHLEGLSFYLTKEQCNRVNRAREIIEDDLTRRANDGDSGLGTITQVSWSRFHPDPEMNASYYLDLP